MKMYKVFLVFSVSTEEVWYITNWKSPTGSLLLVVLIGECSCDKNIKMEQYQYKYNKLGNQNN